MLKVSLASVQIPNADEDVILSEQLHGYGVDLDLGDVLGQRFILIGLLLERGQEEQEVVEQGDLGSDVRGTE